MQLLPVVAALLLLEARSTVQLCAPDCTAMSEGDKVRDPTNCLRYYYCSDPEGNGDMVPSSDPISCPTGLYFNAAESVRECEVISGTQYCTDLCSPCALVCEAPGTLLANPLDCSQYKVCLEDGSTIDTGCSGNFPFFDYQTGFCSKDPSVCYDLCDPCEVYCATEGKVPDPRDCRSYYYCDPPVLAPFTCPENEVFNPDHLFCEVSASGNCTNTC
ncbi:uncharacterized protein [Panulirus ornatus]|uniref:uncharacterized protein n=1 Tax=Panulirus ornatus TaxID=150431 RepID=UPI003A837B0A